MKTMRAPLFAAVLLLAPIHAGAQTYLQEVHAFSDGARLQMSAPVTYNAFRLENPLRLIIDLENTQHAGKPRNTHVPGDGVLKGVRTDQFISPPEGITRVVLDLRHRVHHEITREGAQISIRFSNIAEEEGLKDAVAFSAPLPFPVLHSTPAPIPMPAREDATGALHSIELAGNDAVLYLSHRVEYRTFFLSDPPRFVLDLLDTRRQKWIPHRSAEGGVLRGVRTGIFSGQLKPATRVVFELEDYAPYTFSWRGNSLRLHFEPADTRETSARHAAAGTRDFTGLLLDADGNGLNGSHDLRFYWEGDTLDAYWSEGVTVEASEGFFSAQLGLKRPVPLRASIEVATPPGSNWRVIPTNPSP